MAKLFPGGRTGNRLLDQLPTSEFDRLQPHLRKVNVQVKQVLYEAGAQIEVLYFPIDCALSAVAVMQDGHVIEVATVGYEGVSGLAGLASITRSPHRVFAQIAGEAFKIDAVQLNRECKALPKLSETMSNYQQAFLFQVSQCGACNGLHVVIERCCRWLLMTHDRIDGDELALTHESLAIMLGVRRSGVTEVLQRLQQQGLIRYGHGKIRIVDREGLEELACECYECIRKEYDQLLR